MAVDGSKTQLWRNSAYYKMRVKADINRGTNTNTQLMMNEMQHSQPVINDLPLCYDDVVKIIRGNYHRYFAIIIEESGNVKNFEENGEIA